MSAGSSRAHLLSALTALSSLLAAAAQPDDAPLLDARVADVAVTVADDLVAARDKRDKAAAAAAARGGP